MDDLNSGAPGADEADDLRATLFAAMRGGDEGAAPAPAPEAAPALDVAPVPAASPDTASQPERVRDAVGRFARAEMDAAAKVATAPAAAPVPAVPGQEAPAAQPEPAAEPAATAVRPPPGWSPAAKAAFDTLPAEVRDAVAKREAEVNKGFERLADYKGLDEFAARAKQNGMTAAQLAGQYAAAEQKLASNFPLAVHELSQSFGHHPFAVASAIIGVEPRALAELLQAARSQGQLPAAAQQPAAQPGIPPQLHDHLSRLNQTVNGLVSERTAHQRATSASLVEAFFNDPQYPYAANLETEILDLVSRDDDRSRDPQGALKRAYERAVYLNPETREIAINGMIEARTKAEADKAAQAAQAAAATAARARGAAGSLTGAPTPGAVSPAPGSTPPDDLRAHIRQQMAAGRV